MKTITIVFWAVAILIGTELLLFTYRGLSVIQDYTGVLRWMWLCKIATYVGIGLMGIVLLRIMNIFKRQGYFTQSSIRQLKLFGLLSLCVALANSMANAGMDTWKYYHKAISLSDARERLLFYLAENVFDQSLLVYVLILSIMLFVFFTQKALLVKQENESFI
ncbi:hypothetical protein [Spirosoma validum]|uniref:DUF2975 domain-containing protein n=1 Tax=Spirosoma validum TaxID=2771355 RepID=A0A927GE00_9BACT|nr:hypothetical protein [Spirosoma validum]MBD2754106.1 hypothetical protein [Spirosoma validum]